MKKKSATKKAPSPDHGRKQENLRWLLYIFLIVGLPSLILVGSGIYTYYKAITSASWPSVKGVITEAKVERHESTDDDGDTDVSFCIRYNYIYEVDGTQYACSEYCISTGIYCYSEEKDALAHQMEKGMDIVVYYNPEKPSDSCIQRSEKITHMGAVLIVLGLVFLSVFMLICIGVLNENRK